MSPRPPPKISLKHDWKRELGSEHVQRPGVGQLSRSFQSNKPILSSWKNGRPVVWTDGTGWHENRARWKKTRSQEIDISFFHEEIVSSERTGRPVLETSVIHARSSEDSKDPNVGTAHERTRRLVLEQTQKMCQIVLKHIPNWRRNAKRKSSKESVIDSYEIMNSVSEWLNTIEIKKFVDDGMFLQMKIIFTVCHKKNTTTRTNGGSISISRVLTPYYWEKVLISSKRCLRWNVYKEAGEEPFVPIYS